MLLTATLTAVVFLVSLWGVGRVRVWTERKSILDIPNERSSHANPTPRGGGILITATTIAAIIVAGPRLGGWTWTQTLAFVFASLLIGGISWLDDLRSVPTSLRFLVHTASAAIMVGVFGPFTSVPLPWIGDVALSWAAVPLTVIWIVGLTNAYNFMDGIDGIAGGQAVIAGIAWAIFGSMQHAPIGMLLGLFLAASSLAFLFHNWPPAKIFMGDVGSAFLGFSFAVLPLLTERKTRATALLVGLLVVWPFIFDTAFTFLRRLRHRERVFSAHRSHLYQRLVIAGWSHRSVASIYIALATFGAAAAFGMMSTRIENFMLPSILMAFGVLWVVVVAVERTKKHSDRQCQASATESSR